MLFRTTSSSIALGLVAFASLIAGCIIVDDKGTTTTSASSSTTTSSTTGGGGEGGEDGSGGAGGTATGGGGEGGAASCVGADGTGKTVTSCDDMNITPAKAGGAASSTCTEEGGTDGALDPPGYGYCQHGFEIFTAGSAESLQACLSMISVSPADACDPKQASNCIDVMYAAACPTDYTDTLCTDTGKACDMDPFKVDQCAYQLKTFNDKALETYANCFNTAPADSNCQKAHDDCYDAALLIAP